VCGSRAESCAMGRRSHCIEVRGRAIGCEIVRERAARWNSERSSDVALRSQWMSGVRSRDER
jgi:hypothetical protein